MRLGPPRFRREGPRGRREISGDADQGRYCRRAIAATASRSSPARCCATTIVPLEFGRGGRRRLDRCRRCELGGADGAGARRHLRDRHALPFLAIDRRRARRLRPQGARACRQGDGGHRGRRDPRRGVIARAKEDLRARTRRHALRLSAAGRGEAGARHECFGFNDRSCPAARAVHARVDQLVAKYLLAGTTLVTLGFIPRGKRADRGGARDAFLRQARSSHTRVRRSTLKCVSFPTRPSSALIAFGIFYRTRRGEGRARRKERGAWQGASIAATTSSPCGRWWPRGGLENPSAGS